MHLMPQSSCLTTEAPQPAGGAWTIGYKAWGSLLGRRLSKHGCLVCCLDYRNFPQVLNFLVPGHGAEKITTCLLHLCAKLLTHHSLEAAQVNDEQKHCCVVLAGNALWVTCSKAVFDTDTGPVRHLPHKHSR